MAHIADRFLMSMMMGEVFRQTGENDANLPNCIMAQYRIQLFLVQNLYFLGAKLTAVTGDSSCVIHSQANSSYCPACLNTSQGSEGFTGCQMGILRLSRQYCKFTPDPSHLPTLQAVALNLADTYDGKGHTRKLKRPAFES